MTKTVMRWFVACALCLAGAAQAAQPATVPAQMLCMIEGSDDALRADVGAFVMAEATGAPVNDDEAAVSRLGVIAYECQAQHGWSDAQVQAAIGWAVSRFAVKPAEFALFEAGMDAAAVTGAFEALTAEQRRGFLLDPIAPGSVEALLAGTAARGQTVDTEKDGERVGLLAGLLAQAQDNLAKFEAD